MEAACDKNSANSVFENETKSSPIALTEYNESHDELTGNNNPIKNELNSNNQFHDDLGPETDVDGQDDINSTETSNEFESKSINDFNLSNSMKSVSLENKIIQHLSEQNEDFLASKNPFSSDNFDEHNEKIPQESIDSQSDHISSQQVDNKIIDALESLEMAKEEKEKHQIENITDDLIDTIADSFASPEKMDFFHEKQCTVLESESEKLAEHSTLCSFEVSANQEETDNTDYTQFSTVTGDTCIVEESDDEEEEWNYIKGDRKPLENIQDSIEQKTDDTNQTCEELSNDVPEESATEAIIGQLTEPEVDSSINRFTSMNEANNLWMETEDETKSNDNQQTQSDEPEDLLAQESVGTTTAVEAVLDPITLQNVDCKEQDQRDELQESSLNTVTKPLPEELVSAEETEETDTELDSHRSPTDISSDNIINRPDNLAIEMASKLNPEAKEFVPICSPTRSDPASPVANVPPVLTNPCLILANDIVIAQSPKKDIDTMDNIDVPAEDDFQQEMNDRPHEFENMTACTNGNVEVFRSHSPNIDPFYQEINLKEAMQCDEKLDGDYNDEKQTLIENIVPEAPIEKDSLISFSKEPDAMNTSFYEGRDEPMLRSSSDELNKVHLLPDDVPVDDEEQYSAEETKIFLLEHEENSNTQQVLPNEHDIADSKKINVKDGENHTEPSNNIFGVASQVVNDVTVLVDQMKIDKLINRDVPDLQTATSLKSSHEILPDNKSDNLAVENNNEGSDDVLINLDNQCDMAEPENNLENNINTESVHPNLVEIDTTFEVNKSGTPEVELTQLENSTENDYIDTSVPLVSTTLQNNELIAEQDNIPSENPNKPFEVDFMQQEICATTFTEQPDLKDTNVANNMADQKTCTNVELPTPDIDPNQVKLDINGDPNETTVAVKTVTSTTKTASEKLSTRVSAPPNADKKVSTVSSKANAKQIKPTSTAKKAVPAVKKTVTGAQTTATGDAKKPITVNKAPPASATRSNVVNKAVTEKKTSVVATKKSTTAPVTTNHTDVKSALQTRKPISSTLKPVSTKTTTTSSISNTRPSSTATKTVAPPKLVASTTRPMSSPPGKTSTISTSATAKLRTIPSKITSKITATTTTTVTSRTSITGSSTNKTSNVPSTTAKNLATSKPSTLSSKTNSTTNRASTATNRTSSTTKTSSITIGAQRKSSATPNKKLNSSPTLKSSSLKCSNTNKTTHPSKITSENCLEPNIPENDTKNLPDIDKKLKDDCNQLITKNGIDSQMIVIDSAAD